MVLLMAPDELRTPWPDSDPMISVIHRPHKQGLGPAYAQAFNTLIEGGPHVIIRDGCRLLS